jgi:predicted dehydrogenase
MARERSRHGGRVRVGVVGCGAITQIAHLPTLSRLAGRFEVTAVCDVSRTVLDGVGDRWGVEHRFDRSGALAACDEVDAVLVASPDELHAQAALEAIAAGKDVLVEKPLCLTPAECDEISAAATASAAIVQVGYMRRHASALTEAKAALAGLGEVRFARVHDFLGRIELVIDQAARVIASDDVPAEARAAADASRGTLLDEALGGLPSDVRPAYEQLLSLGCHGTSTMRALLGQPRGVAYATSRHGGAYLSAAIDYGSFVCQFETGYDEIPRFDAHVEVFGSERVLRVEFDTPYVRNLPVRLSLLDAHGGGVVERRIQPDWADPFEAEWLAFHESVTHRIEPAESPADFRKDLELFGAMVGLMSPGRVEPVAG